MTEPNRNRLLTFLGILALFAAVLQIVSLVAAVSPISLAPAYMFSPLLAGAFVCYRSEIPFSAVGFRLGRGRWLAVAALTSLPLVGLTLALSILVPGVGFDPTADPVPGLALPSGILGLAATFGIVLGAGITVNAVFALGEEFGWRGYLLWELAPWGFWKASIAIGTAWGLWHAPVIVAGYNYPSFPIVGVAAMTVACVAFSPLYTYLVVRAKSVLAAALLHGVFNGSAGLVFVFAVAESPELRELVASPVGAAGAGAFGLAAIGIAAVGSPRLSRNLLGDGSSASSSRDSRRDVEI